MGNNGVSTGLYRANGRENGNYEILVGYILVLYELCCSQLDSEKQCACTNSMRMQAVIGD